MTSKIHRSPRLLALTDLALAAGREILTIYANPVFARQKADLTPVTEADEAAEKVILAGLKQLDPEIPVISEEAAAAGLIPAVAERFYLVDPLDGTKEFLSRNGEFTVNIALIREGDAGAGVVLAPALGRIFCGETGSGAFEARCEAELEAASLDWRELKVRRPRPRGRSSSPAARIATSAPRPISNASRCRKSFPPDPRSNSAFWHREKPTSIRVSAERWNGTPRQAMRCLPPPAVMSKSKPANP